MAWLSQLDIKRGGYREVPIRTLTSFLVTGHFCKKLDFTLFYVVLVSDFGINFVTFLDKDVKMTTTLAYLMRLILTIEKGTLYHGDVLPG